MAKHTLKILRCLNPNNFKVCVAILQHHAWLNIIHLTRFRGLSNEWKNMYANLRYSGYTQEAVVQRCSIKNGVPRKFTKFKGKHLCQSLF